MSDFDRYCDERGINDPKEFPAAFAAWMNDRTGWDGDMNEVVPGGHHE
jgi:hypothetical protein